MEINIDAFKKLIKRYETITLKEIKEKDARRNELTGFGNNSSCTLCRAINSNDKYFKDKLCQKCVWFKTIKNSSEADYRPCYDEDNGKTYKEINDADTAEELFFAYRNRAKHMRKTLTKLGYKQP